MTPFGNRLETIRKINFGRQKISVFINPNIMRMFFCWKNGAFLKCVFAKPSIIDDEVILTIWQ